MYGDKFINFIFNILKNHNISSSLTEYNFVVINNTALHSYHMCMLGQ